MPRYLIIDGYNAISKIKPLEATKDKSLEASRLYFIKLLKDFTARKKTFDKVFVVFDSQEEAFGVRKTSYGKVEALFGTATRDADSVIVDMLKKAAYEDKISISSDDNFVRNHARAFGRDVISIKDLKRIIMLKEENFRGRIRRKEIKIDNIRDINEELKKHWGIR